MLARVRGAHKVRLVRSLLAQWDELPDNMRVPEIRPYWEALDARYAQLVAKRAFDVSASVLLLVLLAPIMVVVSAAIKFESKGPVLYKQERVTQYGRHFRIHKFRTMVDGADKNGPLVTTKADLRVTRVGTLLRKYRIDEFPQLIDVLVGDMSFVGTRPEVPKYVEAYVAEWKATLLLPAGITSKASIRYKDESRLLEAAEDVDRVYIGEVLPAKMHWNLESERQFSVLEDILTMLRTVAAVSGKE